MNTRCSARSSRGLAALSAAILLVAPSAAQAQQKFWGFLGGATLSDISNYYATATTDSRWGVTAGLIVGMRTYRSTTVALEPAWIQRGGGDLKSDAFEIPLTFGAAVRSGDGMMRYGFYSGIGVAFKLSCSSPDIPSVGDPCNQMNGSDWFIPIGFRLARQVGAAGAFFGLDVRYAVPLDSSFDLIDASQRPWSFRLMYVKCLGT